MDLAKRAALRFRDNGLADSAAALTYYGLLSIFPMLIALVSLIGLFGDPQGTTRTLTDIVADLGPDSAVETFSGPIESVASSRGTAGFALFFGLAIALWSASGYIGAFIRASNVVYGVEEDRPFWELRPLQVAVTLAMIGLLALVAIGLVLTGPVVRAVAEPIGVSGTAVTVWEIAKWPVLIAAFTLLLSILYYASPNVREHGFRLVTLGGFVALAAWALSSALFGLYVSNFGSYDKTYGSLAGVIVLLIWLWIANLAILFGHQLNAERERSGAERSLAIRTAPPPRRERSRGR